MENNLRQLIIDIISSIGIGVIIYCLMVIFLAM